MENKVKELEEKLLRKEQECEELKIYIESNEQQVKEVEMLVMDNDRLINELDQLKAENEELNRQLKKEIEASQKWYQLHTEEHFAKLKLEATLTEIKEIALGVRNYLDCPSPKDVRYEMDRILQLISEVEHD